MLTLQVPTLLALLGTVLMAVVIFAPAAPTVQREPALAPPQAYSPLPFDALAPLDVPPFSDPPRPSTPHWPALVDPSAAACDAAARLALAGALGAVRTPWAAAILGRALAEETDPAVRAAIADAQVAWGSGYPASLA
jgi:hypothetical protein